MVLPIHSIDFAIIIIYMIASIALGVWVSWSGRNRSVEDFALGGRDVAWWAILGSIVATETSSATFLSVTGKPVFEGGDCRFLQLAFGYVLGRLAVSLILLPQYFRGRITTAYEVLAKRFGANAQKAASLIFLLARNLGDGLRLYLCAIALNLALGISLPLSILVTGIVTLIYTMIGGIRSVIWNDCVQFVIYIAGGIAALWVLVTNVPGGWSEILAHAQATDRWRVFVFAPETARQRWEWMQWLLSEPYTFYAGIVGGMFLTFGTHGVDQMMVQRYLCARSERDAAWALVSSGIVVLAQFALFLTIGVALSAFIKHFPVPIESAKADRVFAWFIVEHMPVGLCGLTLAALLAAAMSTLSSSLNASATAVVGDLSTKEFATVFATQMWTVFFGFVQIAIALGAQYVSSSVVDEALTIAGFTVGVLLGIFLLGLISKRASEGAALLAIFGGSAVMLFIQFYTPVTGIWFAAIGCGTTLLIGLLASALLASDGRKTELDSARE